MSEVKFEAEPDVRSLFDSTDIDVAKLDEPTLEAVLRVLDARVEYLNRVIDAHDGKGTEAEVAHDLLYGVGDAAAIVEYVRFRAETDELFRRYVPSR